MAIARLRPATAPPHARALALAAVVWLFWLIAVIYGDRWALVRDNLAMTVTMIFGSMVAGATSEGGGAVAFPVLTLGFGAAPAVARDFALMIQSIGMTAAAATIIWTRIPIATRPLIAAIAGGVPGIVIGIALVGPMLPAAPTKLAFVALWASFGLALGWSIRRRRPVAVEPSHIGPRALALIAGCACVGGVISGICGSGIDIVVFSVLTLAFGLDERIATPTSVVLMASNASFGFAWRLLGPGPAIAPEAWGYWWAAVPVVVIGAPLGARLIVGRSRRFVVRLLQLSIAIQLVGALAIVPLDVGRIGVLGGTFAGGLILFSAFRWAGDRRAQRARRSSSLPALIGNRS